MTIRNSVDRWMAGLGAGGCLIWIAVTLASIGGWVTHVVYCIDHEKWGFLIAGAIAAPVGVIHGWGIWFGWWG